MTRCCVCVRGEGWAGAAGGLGGGGAKTGLPLALSSIVAGFDGRVGMG